MKLNRILCFLPAIFIIFYFGLASAAPSEDEIVLLEPSETIYATPFIGSVDDLAVKHNIELGNKDIVKAFPSLGFGLGGVVKIWEAPQYKIVDETREHYVDSWGLTINEVVEDAGIEIGEQDQVDPGLEAVVAGNPEINITRVKETEQKETEIIYYKTIERSDPTLERGKTEVYQEGSNGTREKTYLVRRENGEEVSRTLINNEITEQAQNKIILVGTKIVVLSSESGEASWTWGVTASRKYSKGTLIRVTNLSNGKSVETRVGGYGPMSYTGRILDLNIDAWEQIAPAGKGTTNVKVEELNE